MHIQTNLHIESRGLIFTRKKHSLYIYVTFALHIKHTPMHIHTNLHTCIYEIKGSLQVKMR